MGYATMGPARICIRKWLPFRVLHLSITPLHCVYSGGFYTSWRKTSPALGSYWIARLAGIRRRTVYYTARPVTAPYA
jgi:hypothetical protein